MQITAEITQTYDLLKFTIARSNGSNFSLQHNTKCPPYLHKLQWRDKKGRETDKKTANVQIPRTVGVVRPANPILHTVNCPWWIWAGAIIGVGDRNRAPFLVLGLAPWYGTICLFLEQIAPSPAAHARTCCEDFCGCREGEMASEIHEIVYAFGPQLNMFMSVGIWL